MKQQVNTKGYGTLKKLKGVGLAGVLTLFVGVAIAGTQTAYGDEVVAPVASSDVATFDVTATVDDQVTPVADATFEEIAADQAVETTTVAPATEAEVATDQAVAETPVVAETPAVSEEAAQVANTTTARVSHEQTTATESRASIEVATTVNEPVKEGQFVEYTFTNLPTGGLNNQDVTIEDGTVVGKLEVVGQEPMNYGSQQNNTRDNQSAEDQALSPASMNNTFKLRMVFNKAAEEVADLSYKFGFTNQYYNHFISSVEYAYASKISIGDKTVATDTVQVAAYPMETIKDTTVTVDSNLSSVESANNGLELKNGKLALSLRNSSSEPITEGSLITVKVDGTALVTLTNKVGDVLKQNSQRGYYQDTEVNANNVILNDMEQAAFEVVSNDGETIVLKALTTLEKTNKYGLDLSVNYTPSSDEISEDGKKITGINNTQLTVTDPAGNVIYTTERDNDTANIYGNSITAEAAFTGKLIVRHETRDGQLLKEETPRAGKEGEAYTTSVAEFDDYHFIYATDNTSGTFTRGTTTVVYTYDKVDQPVPGDPGTPTDPEPQEPQEQIPNTPQKPRPNRPDCYVPVYYGYIACVPVSYIRYYCPPVCYYAAGGYANYSNSYSYSSYSSYSYSYRSYSYSRTSYNFGYSASYPSYSYALYC